MSRRTGVQSAARGFVTTGNVNSPGTASGGPVDTGAHFYRSLQLDDMNGRYRREKLAGERVRVVVSQTQRQPRSELLVRMPLESSAPLQCPDPAESIARARDAFLPGVAALALYRKPCTESIVDRAADEAAQPHSVEPTVSRIQSELQRVRGFRGDVVHGAAGGVLPEERALRTLQYLHAFDVEAGQRRHRGIG